MIMIHKIVNVGDFSIGEGQPLCLIAGPCVLEEGDINFKTAQKVKQIAEKVGLSYIFKGSFDKANRTSVHSFRGPGLKEGLHLLDRIKNELELPVLTDVHAVDQVDLVADVVDVIQIPAFLCRQTDLLVEAGRTGKVVNVKKGQFMSPENMVNAVEKITSTGNEKIMLTERGAFFGYGDLVVDMRSIPKMQKFGFPVIFDAGHSLQKPGAAGTFTAGDRDFVPYLARGAVAVGCDGVFLEVHPIPDQSPSDSQTIWPLDKVEEVVTDLVKIHELKLRTIKNTV